MEIAPIFTADEKRFIELMTEIVTLIDRLPEQHRSERRQGYEKSAALTDWAFARSACRTYSQEAVRNYQAAHPNGTDERRLDKLEAQASNLAASVRHVRDALTRIESRQITTRA